MAGTVTISGLQSKIDIEDTISKLVAARRYTLTSFEKAQTEVNYDLEAWNDLAALSGELTNSLDTLRTWETWNTMAATSSDEDTLTAKATTSAVPNTYSVFINNLAQSHSIGSSKASDLTPGGNANTDLVAPGILNEGASFTIEGQTITIGASETLNTLVGKINTAATSMSADSRVSASILDGRLVISREKTGSTELNISDVIGSPLETLGVLNASGGYVNELMEAVDANFTVNGIAVTRSSNTGLDDVITGVTLDLRAESVAAPVRLTINHDTEDAKAAILDYMEKYNALAAQVRFYTQKPLSGETSGGASITALGELYNDSSLSSMERNIRMQATASKYPYLNATNAAYTYAGKTGVADSLEDIGIWTQGENNVLALTDEDKLDYMLENEFDVTAQLFRGVYDSTQGYVHGLATDFYKYSNSMSESLTGEIARRIASLEDKLTELSERITSEEETLDDYQDRLIETFSAMEEAEATFNAQLDWFRANFSN